jgi:MraZ protein
MFRGSAPATIDEKGRLKVPAEFRRTLEERYGVDLFVTSVDGEAASLYPLSVWEAIESRLMAMPATHPVRQRFLERVSYFGQQGQLDAQGRLVMPTILRGSAEMNGEVVVSGRLDHLVVWNRQRFESRIAAEPFEQKDFEALSAFGI